MAACLPPRKVRKHFMTRYTVKNGISNLYIYFAQKCPQNAGNAVSETQISKQSLGGGGGGGGGVACSRIPLQLCCHCVTPTIVSSLFPLTEILATPLKVFMWKINIKTRSIEAISL